MSAQQTPYPKQLFFAFLIAPFHVETPSDTAFFTHKHRETPIFLKKSIAFSPFSLNIFSSDDIIT